MSKRTEALHRYVEAFADAVAESGMPPLGGRVLGYLLVSEPGCQTAAEVAEALGESRRETAGMLVALARSGMLEAIALPGREEAGYAVRTVDEMIAGPARRAAAMRRVSEQGLAVAEGGEAMARLAEMADFYAFMEQELGTLVSRWRAERRKSRAPRA